MRAFALLLVLGCSGCVVPASYPYAPYSYAPYPPPVATAVPAPQAAAAQPTCRDFDTPVTIDGKEQEAKGTACLQPDGSWKVQQDVPDQPPQSYVIAPQAYQAYYPPDYLANPWYYGPPLFFGGVFVGGGWGYHHGHGGWHGAWHGGGHGGDHGGWHGGGDHHH